MCLMPWREICATQEVILIATSKDAIIGRNGFKMRLMTWRATYAGPEEKGRALTQIQYLQKLCNSAGLLMAPKKVKAAKPSADRGIGGGGGGGGRALHSFPFQLALALEP